MKRAPLTEVNTLVDRVQAHLGLSDYALAPLLGINRKTILNWRSGRHAPTVNNWRRLARTLRDHLTGAA